MDQDLTYLGFYRVLSSSTTYRWVQNQLKIIHRTTLVCEDGPHLGNTEVQYLVVDLASGRTEAKIHRHRELSQFHKYTTQVTQMGPFQGQQTDPKEIKTDSHRFLLHIVEINAILI